MLRALYEYSAQDEEELTLYEYSAQDEEELTFPEGAEIQLLHTDEGVDDGFWKGRYEGKVGMFPSVIENGPVTSLPSLPLPSHPLPITHLHGTPSHENVATQLISEQHIHSGLQVSVGPLTVEHSTGP